MYTGRLKRLYRLSINPQLERLKKFPIQNRRQFESVFSTPTETKAIRKLGSINPLNSKSILNIGIYQVVLGQYCTQICSFNASSLRWKILRFSFYLKVGELATPMT